MGNAVLGTQSIDANAVAFQHKCIRGSGITGFSFDFVPLPTAPYSFSARSKVVTEKQARRIHFPRAAVGFVDACPQGINAHSHSIGSFRLRRARPIFLGIKNGVKVSPHCYRVAPNQRLA